MATRAPACDTALADHPAPMEHAMSLTLKAAAAALLCTSLSGLVLAQQKALTLPVDVRVVNQSAEAVPVTGSVSTRDVDNPARSPFQATVCTTTSFGGAVSPTCSNQTNIIQSSANRRTVIEYVSGECGISGDINIVRLVLGTTVGGTGAQHQLHLQRDPIDSRFLDIVQQTRIYADPGTSIGFGGSFGGGAGAGSARCVLTISGYTVAI